MIDGDLYIDKNGKKYTTCPIATETDPWWGAEILFLGSADRLRAAGLLPLTEVVHPRWADDPRYAPRKSWWRRFIHREKLK